MSEITKDSNGAQLADRDAVTLIKDCTEFLKKA